MIAASAIATAIPEPVFRRPDGQPIKILMRGDCTSRRAIHLNRDLFPDGVQVIQNEKSPVLFSLDALQGLSPSAEQLKAICDVGQMERVLADFYLGQADHSILEQTGADIILIDSYADMNFEIWEHKDEGWKCWIHPRYLKDPERFHETFTSLRRRTLSQSVKDCLSFIKAMRAKNPHALVLMLNQQIEHYPKMKNRQYFYDLGRIVSEKVKGAYYGGVIAPGDLQLDDVGSCGPGLTLHFQAQTYRAMLLKAAQNGLSSALLERARFSEFNFENPETPSSDDILLRYGSPYCQAKCGDAGQAAASMGKYIAIAGHDTKLRWTPVVIKTDDIRDYAAWEQQIKKRYDRVRMKKRAEKLGYVTHLFHPKLHTADRHAIHQSMPARSGGAMRASSQPSIDDMGGLPIKAWAPVMPACPYHWSLTFGIFLPKPGHRQGDVTVDEQLIAYLSVRRFGDVLLYSVIFGHGDHLDNGVMYLLHFDVIRWVSAHLNSYTKDLRYIMYGGMENGGAGLWQWKRTVGFAPCQLFAFEGRASFFKK